MKRRILYLIHGHDMFAVGGAENAAFSLFREIRSLANMEAWIIAAMSPSTGMLSHGELRCIENQKNEYIIGTSCDWFSFRNSNIIALHQGIKPLVNYIKPDAIHIQHYLHFGIDIVPLMKSICPTARIILTLHEYLGICLNNGQMITTYASDLCHSSSTTKCAKCYPGVERKNIFLRNNYIRNILESCDHLISPSNFLIERYRASGVNRARFTMIENGLPSYFDPTKRSVYLRHSSNKLNRFAYFGQLNQFKGILLLLRAARLLLESGRSDFRLCIYGANLDHQPREFQESLSTELSSISCNVFLHGSYKQNHIEELMLDNDWVVVPSTWWENSPVVIQEAFFFGRPVIGSNIGGIREKIEGHGGILFENRNETSLANTMEKCLGNRRLRNKLIEEISAPQLADCAAHEHIRMIYSNPEYQDFGNKDFLNDDF